MVFPIPIFCPSSENVPVKTLVDRTAGTLITDFSTRSTNAFDGTTNRGQTTCATGGTYIGKTWSSPKIFAEAVIYGSNDVGFSSTGTPSITLSIYGKNGAAPSSASDGTLLGTITFTETNNESGGRTITSTDNTNAWDHWFLTETGHSGNLRLAQVTWSEWL